jgi:4'-phosphopantetheinyl transferase
MEHITIGQIEACAEVPALASDEIHLWLMALEGAIPPRAISGYARAQLGRFLRAYAADCEQPPSISRNDYGKPFVLEAGYPYFNLSHAGRFIAFAFSRTQDIGVDVEAFRRRRAPLLLAERFFSPDETKALATLDSSQLDNAFVRLWTGKEAVLKALGRGIAFGLERLSFRVTGDGIGGELISIAEEAGPVDAWQLCRFDADHEHCGALAWRGAAQKVRAMRVMSPVSLSYPVQLEC